MFADPSRQPYGNSLVWEYLEVPPRDYFAPEHLAPPVNERMLIEFLEDTLSEAAREEARDMITTFGSWHSTFAKLLATRDIEGL